MVLYMGDTAKKQVIYDQDQLARIGVPITEHDKLPDVVLFDPAKNSLFLVPRLSDLHGQPAKPRRSCVLSATRGNQTVGTNQTPSSIRASIFPSRPAFVNFS